MHPSSLHRTAGRSLLSASLTTFLLLCDNLRSGEEYPFGMQRAGSFLREGSHLGCVLRCGGFTLVELLVILLSLFSMLLLVPSLVRQHRRAAAKQCENNLKQVGLA